jgi:opacity protein-like surface antigen
MKRVLIAAAALLCAAAAASAADAALYYRIEMAPSGSMIASDRPVVKGNTYLFHGYPSGTLVSLRRSDVRRIVQIDRAAATAVNPADRVVSIGNLAMQGGSTQAGPTNASAVRKTQVPEIGKGFYGNVVPGITEGLPNSLNDYKVGRTYAAPPANAIQSAPGDPPMMPENPQR